MKCFSVAFLALTATAAGHQDTNPISKVVQLLTDLQAKVIKDGEAEQKAFEEYADWCQNGAKDKEFEIKTAKADIEDLEAVLSKAGADIVTHSAKIEELAAAISTNSADLKAATEIRDAEHADFAANEAELVDALDTLDRATSIIEKTMRGSALVQAKLDTSSLSNMLKALEAVVDAASLNSHDKQKLLALAQSDSSDDDATMGAPAPDAYKSHSSSIVDVLDDLREKAEAQLQEARKAEMNSNHNYEMLKQSVEDQLKVDNKGLAKAKQGKASGQETTAVAKGDLAVTQKDLADAEKVLGGMHMDCMLKSQDHEASVKSRAEELTALAGAKKIIESTTGGAVGQSYSLLQVIDSHGSTTGSQLRTGLDLANFEVVSLLRRLAKAQHSTQLSQLASRVNSAIRLGSANGADPFVKVKELISGMIERLAKEGEEEATHKAYCDKEMAETNQKRAELQHDIENLSTKIDKATAQSAKLKQEVAQLQKELAEIASSQAEMDKIRGEEHAAFVQTKSDLEQGLEGVRMALKVLKDYYSSSGETAELLQSQQPAAPVSHQADSGSSSGIIGMLEVVESDFSKNLASAETEEDAAAQVYEKTSMENRVSKAMKEQDVKYKTKEAASLDKSSSELAADLQGAQTELDAVLSYTKNLRGMCETKVESYAERKGRRDAEIAGLKEALTILEGEAVLLQRHASGHGLRGVDARRH